MNADRPPYDAATLALKQARLRAMADAGLSDDEILWDVSTGLCIGANPVQTNQLMDYLHEYRLSRTPSAGPQVRAAVPVRPDGPIATREQAVEAFELHGSERPAARAIGVSRTQLRRLMGKQK